MKDCCIFGPIRSRRLGISMGIDLLPYKTCSLDCVYCECGKTTNHTARRSEFFPTDKAILQIDAALAKHPVLDYITFSGSGEPTLHSGIGRIIRHIKENYPAVKVCLLTNSTLLPLPGVIDEVAPADLIIPSLDGSNESEFIAIDRPCPGVCFEKIVSAIAELKRRMSGEMWLEIFLRAGVNDSAESAERFRKLAEIIHPDKVQLNTLDRPGTEPDVAIPSAETLEMIRQIISSSVPTGITGGGANPDRRNAHVHELEKAGITHINRK